jgi:hypothetical protein
MGFSVTSLHVRTLDRERAITLDALAEHLRWQAIAGAYHELDDPAAPADREILLVPHPGPWVAVYDTALDFAGEDTLTHLATALSNAVNNTALLLQVVDSDLVVMRRFHAGSLIDSFVSDPEYLGLDDDGSLAGEAERWQDLLAPGQTAADLRTVWDEQLIFAQHTLGYAAEVLGLDPYSGPRNLHTPSARVR